MRFHRTIEMQRVGIVRPTMLLVSKDAALRVSPAVWQDYEWFEETAEILAKAAGVFVSLDWQTFGRTQYAGKMIIQHRRMEMAKKIGEWKGFADIALSKSDKKAAKEYANEGDRVLTDLENLVGSSYKVTISVDTRNDVHMVSVSCYDANSPNFKHTMVTRGRTAWGTLCAALYKHWHVADGKWQTQDDAEIDF